MAASLITSRMEGQMLPSLADGEYVPPAIVAPDRLNVRLRSADVPDELIKGFKDFRGSFNRDGEIYGVAAKDHNMYVRNGNGGVLVAGAPRVWAAAENIVPFGHPFGPEETGLTMDAVDVRLGLPVGTYRAGRLTYLEFSADLPLPVSPSRFVAACEDLPRTTPYRFGRTTLYHHTEEVELRLYSKSLQLGVEGNVLRVECLFRRGGVPDKLAAFKDEHGVVRAGLLADAAFRDELARLWVAYARRLRFRRVPHAAVAPEKASERVKLLAVRGLEASGGLSEVLAEIDADVAAGRLSNGHAKSQKRALRELARNPDFSVDSDLDAAFAAAVDAIEGGLFNT